MNLAHVAFMIVEDQFLQGGCRKSVAPTRKGFAFGSKRVNSDKTKDWHLRQFQIGPENTQTAITQEQKILSLDFI